MGNTNITIEEAKKLGLTRIVKQLEKDKRARESLGLDPQNKIPKKFIFSKLIRVNFHDLT